MDAIFFCSETIHLLPFIKPGLVSEPVWKVGLNYKPKPNPVSLQQIRPVF